MPDRLHRQKLSDWVPACGLSVLLIGLFLAGPGVTVALRYDRHKVLDGEWWRLLSGHLVHGDGPHLGWNLLGLWLVVILFMRDLSLRGWLLVTLVSTAAIDAGFLWLEPGLEWYVGLSGVLHGLMAAGLVAWLAQDRDRLSLTIAALFAGKLAWEQLAGPLPFTSATLTLPVVYSAHAYGALGGLIAAGGIIARQRRPPASL